jgi:drug/metabolite transporter (DMT)-like permease
MDLTVLSWINGISDVGVVVSGFVFGCYYLFQYRETKKKYYPVVAVLMFCIGIGWTGIFLSFIAALAGNPNQYVNVTPIFSYITIPPGFIMCTYLAFDVFYDPKLKRALFLGLAIFSVCYYILIYGFFNIAIQKPPVNPGNLFDDSLSPFWVPYYLVAGADALNFYLLGTSFFALRKKISGTERKRSTLLFFAMIFLTAAIVLDILVWYPQDLNFVFIARVCMLLGNFCFFWGFRIVKPSPAEKQIVEITVQERKSEDVDFAV